MLLSSFFHLNTYLISKEFIFISVHAKKIDKVLQETHSLTQWKNKNYADASKRYEGYRLMILYILYEYN